MLDDKTNSNSQIDSTNIFEDFKTDTKLWKEVKDQEKKAAKDVFYYLKIFTGCFKILNLVAILCVCVFLLYSFFQNRDSLDNYSFLAPVCSLFLWDVADEVSGCYSLEGFSNKTSTDLKVAQEEQFDRVVDLFEYVYELDNFANSSEVNFLLNASESRLKPLEILWNFDLLKNKFEPIDKSKVQCSDIVIRDDMTLSARCEAFSSDWDSDITWLDNSKNSWTSISIASSFIQFLENDSESNFKLITKQKVFDFETVSGNGIYTKKTSFDLELRYTDTNNLAL